MSRLSRRSDRATERALTELVDRTEVEAALASPAPSAEFEADALERMRAHAQAHPHAAAPSARQRSRAWLWGSMVAAAAALALVIWLPREGTDPSEPSPYLSAGSANDPALSVRGRDVSWEAVDDALAFTVTHWTSSDEESRKVVDDQVVFESHSTLTRAPLPGESVTVEWHTEDGSKRQLRWSAAEGRGN